MQESRGKWLCSWLMHIMNLNKPLKFSCLNSPIHTTKLTVLPWLKYSHPWVSMRDWFQDLLWIPKCLSPLYKIFRKGGPTVQGWWEVQPDELVISFANLKRFNKDGADRGNQSLCTVGTQQTLVVRPSTHPDSRNLRQGRARAESKRYIK